MNIKFLKKIIIKYKWKISRHLVKKRDLSFKKMMVRMHHIQKIDKLNKYDKNKLVGLSYTKVRKIFIKNFPNEYLHNPKY